MKYLWDTDTCIYHLNGNSKVKQNVRSVGAKSIYTTIVTIAELKFGAFNSILFTDCQFCNSSQHGCGHE